jgi:hypothetical protein
MLPRREHLGHHHGLRVHDDLVAGDRRVRCSLQPVLLGLQLHSPPLPVQLQQVVAVLPGHLVVVRLWPDELEYLHQHGQQFQCQEQ